MKANKEAMQKRANTLAVLIKGDFDPTNENHIAALKDSIDEFEFSYHCMRVAEALSPFFEIWKYSWFTKLVLSTPEFISPLLSACFYFGLPAYLIAKLNHNNFQNQLEDMMTLYNWALKGGTATLKPGYDNSAALAHPEVQRMFPLMAPLCDVNFMLAWERVTEVKVESKGFMASLGSFVPSFFSSPPPVSNDQVKDLKIKIETGGFKPALYDHTINYMKDSQAFRDISLALVKQELAKPLNLIRSIPERMMSMSTTSPTPGK